MNKAEEFLDKKAAYRIFPNSNMRVINRDTVIELMQLYADEQSREEAIKLLPWYEGTRHKHKGKTWIDIYDDGIKWIKEQEEQK